MSTSSPQADPRSGGKKSPHNYNMAEEGTEELKGHVNRYGVPGQAERYMKTTKAVAEYVGRVYGKDMWKLVHEKQQQKNSRIPGVMRSSTRMYSSSHPQPGFRLGIEVPRPRWERERLEDLQYKQAKQSTMNVRTETSSQASSEGVREIVFGAGMDGFHTTSHGGDDVEPAAFLI